jgi:UDP-N-acetylglucosamine--N-acetylmuramyl-(pentapeptide) pyrophosphoryl-undecaprenol N-acetylglucosamine transferase
MKKAPKILISGGGTGGHVFPAIAIGQAFRAQHPNAKILFVGAKGKMEMKKVPDAGFEIVGLSIAGFQRKQLWKNWSFPFKLIASLWRSFFLVLSFKPDALIGVGGYASGPLLKVGQILGKKTYLQEQNAFPGATNRILGKKAKWIFAGFPGLEKFFDASKIRHTGNPIRADLTTKAVATSEDFSAFGLKEGKPVLLVIGGSLGARTLNEGMKKNLVAILDLGYQVIWQCGKSGKAFAEEFAGIEGVWVGAFINEMPLVYRLANVVISRAGALSIAEILAQQIPAIFVPSPNVTNDHQTKNAVSVVHNKGGVLVKDAEFGENLIQGLQDMQGAGVIDTMIQSQKALAKIGAAKEIVQIISEDIHA